MLNIDSVKREDIHYASLNCIKNWTQEDERDNGND